MKRAIPYLLAAAAVIAGFASLHQYNVTWDEAIGDLFFGQRYFSYFTSFDARYLDFAANPYPPSFKPDLSASPFRMRPWEHYPVASTLATATSRLFAPILDPFDGYHALNLLLGAIFLIVFYRFAEKHFGTLAAFPATLFLFLAPRIAGDAMANVKDFAEMAFFGLTAIALFEAIERGKIALIVLTGVLWGLALGTKANALFLPLIFILYLLWRGLPQRRTAVALALAGCFALGALVFFVSWPYLWHDPIGTLRSNAAYLLARKSGTRPENTSGPFAMIFFTTPPLFLVAFAAGVVPMARELRKRTPAAVFLTSWIAVVCARLALPNAVNFDGVRHFLELFPPMAIVAAMSVPWMIARLTLRARAVAVGALALATIIPLAMSHPFESAYWNIFAGGLPGAMARKNPQAGDYWAASYRIGLRWLNEHAPAHSLLAVPIAEHAVRIVAPYRLRADIHLLHTTNAWSPRIDARAIPALERMSERQPVYVMFVLRRDWSNELVARSFASYRPVVTWTLDGAPVLVIFRVTLKR